MTGLRRRGFALLTVLWGLALAAAVSMASRIRGADAITASRNRIEAERGRWRTASCLSLLHSSLNARFSTETDRLGRERLWQRLDLAVEELDSTVPCAVRIEPIGIRLDVNRASATELITVFRAAGEWAQAEQLAAAILDWRDEDGVSRRADAEQGWYRRHKRFGPRNGPLRSMEELSLVRGFAERPQLLELLGIDGSPLVVSHAPLAVLASVPGFTPPVLAHVALVRDRKILRSLTDIMPGLTSDGTRDLLANFEAASRAVRMQPEAWELTLQTALGRPVIITTRQARLVRSESNIHVASSRAW